VTVDRRGEGIGQSLVGAVISAARAAGIRLLSVRPVARNTDAIGFFRDLGFGVLGHVEVFMDLTERADRWVPGETIADRDFAV